MSAESLGRFSDILTNRGKVPASFASDEMPLERGRIYIGGVAIVPAPDDAAQPEMPSCALLAVPDARRVTIEELAEVLYNLASESARLPAPVPDVLRIEALLTERATKSALQTLRERVEMYDAMAGDDRRSGRVSSLQAVEAKARETREQANTLQNFVLRISD